MMMIETEKEIGVSDIVERLRADAEFTDDIGLSAEAADEIESLRQRVKELETKAEMDYAIMAGDNALITGLKDELATLKQGQGEPVGYAREYAIRFMHENNRATTINPQPLADDDIALYTSAPTIPDSSIEHCLTCANRGEINGTSQETFCEQCIYQRTWRKDHYKPAAPKPEE